MKYCRIFKQAATLVVGFALLLTSGPAGAETMPAASDSAQQAWRRDIEQTKRARNGFITAGVIGTVGGTVTFLTGYNEVLKADDVPGCTRDGSSVLCDDVDSKNEAQDHIDTGQQQMLVGLVVMSVGVVLGIVGFRQNGKLRNLEELGRFKGYTVTSRIRDSKEIRLALERSF